MAQNLVDGAGIPAPWEDFRAVPVTTRKVGVLVRGQPDAVDAAHLITDDAPEVVADLALDWFDRAA